MIPAQYANVPDFIPMRYIDWKNEYMPQGLAKKGGGMIRDRVMKKGGTLLEEAEDDSWSAYFEEMWSSITSDTHLPKRFRKFIKAHGREPITSLKMVRAPVATPGVIAVQLITAGKWNELKKKAGFDEVFHTGVVINDKYVIEKLEKLEAREDPEYLNQGGKAEIYPLDMGAQKGNINIAELLENARTKMGKSFYTYSAWDNNCQNFVMNLADASGFLDAEGRAWIKQDIKELVKEIPNLSKWLGIKLTNIARDITNLGEEALAKRGGMIMGQQRVKGRGGF